ncbi:protein CHROMOSOME TRANSMISSION FIDELITY 7-like [Humulus lupulus]|uniref:protein CHROMOSOME TRANSMISSION FIDELITY 7-like n=1 Tax=Humulus lupulus TaxID=3486 RepID=UPI002B40B098|nr:protein CHROMOSOME TRANSMISSION FIDELITY 7-like [Humulus lupulus]
MIIKCAYGNFSGDDLLKHVLPDLPVDLQQMLLLLFQKYRSQWKEDVSKEQPSSISVVIFLMKSLNMGAALSVEAATQTGKAVESEIGIVDLHFSFEFRGILGEREKAKDGQWLEKTISGSITSKSESFTSRKIMVKNKKRSYAQYHLDLGQFDFNFHSCSTCGFKYSLGDESDEKAHKEFHKNYTHGIQFKGWSSERVIQMPTIEGGRIVMVLDSDSTAQKKKVVEAMNMMGIELGSGFIFLKFCKVLLFILSNRVAGCLIAEPIKKTFKVISNSVDNDAINTKEKRTKPTILQFGDISFQRETVKRSHSASNTNLLDGDLGSAVVCEEVAVPAVCGIRAIWVSPVNGRQRIATQR